MRSLCVAFATALCAAQAADPELDITASSQHGAIGALEAVAALVRAEEWEDSSLDLQAI
jgi:hypothetical protein